MNKWLIVLGVLAVWFVLMEIQNRKQRPLFEKVEKENPELLDGRFQKNPVLRRKFMRALVKYCCTQGFSPLAFAQARGAAQMAKEPLDRAACAMLMALNLEEKGDYGALVEAIRLYDEVLEAEPFNLKALYLKAKALGAIGEADCVELFEEVIRRAPDNYIYHNNYGSALLRIRRFEEAEVQLKKAAELNDSLSNPHELLYLLYSAADRREEAEHAFSAAVNRGSDESGLRAACRTFLENLKEE